MKCPDCNGLKSHAQQIGPPATCLTCNGTGEIQAPGDYQKPCQRCKVYAGTYQYCPNCGLDISGMTSASTRCPCCGNDECSAGIVLAKERLNQKLIIAKKDDCIREKTDECDGALDEIMRLNGALKQIISCAEQATNETAVAIVAQIGIYAERALRGGE